MSWPRKQQVLPMPGLRLEPGASFVWGRVCSFPNTPISVAHSLLQQNAGRAKHISPVINDFSENFIGAAVAML
jgi:hypothetical protein